MHYHLITFSPRSFHMAENPGTGKRRLNKVRSTRTERSPSAAQCFTCGLPGMLGNQAPKNGIGINHINIAKPCRACQCRFPAPIRASHHIQGWHSCHPTTESGFFSSGRGGFIDYSITDFCACNIASVRPDTVECSASFKLGCQVCLDLFAPIFRSTRDIGEARNHFHVFGHSKQNTSFILKHPHLENDP